MTAIIASIVVILIIVVGLLRIPSPIWAKIILLIVFSMCVVRECKKQTSTEETPTIEVEQKNNGK
jgi:hypothetical protein